MEPRLIPPKRTLLEAILRPFDLQLFAGPAEITSQRHNGVGVTVTSVTPTLAAAPTVGNCITICLAINSNATFTTPTGWTAGPIVQYAAQSRAMAFFYRVVQTGDTATGPVCTISAAANIAWVMTEYSGVSATAPLNQSASGNSGGSVATWSSPAVTPNVLNTLPVAYFSLTVGYTVTSVGTGWTNDLKQTTSNPPFIEMQHAGLTADTTTAQQATLTASAAGFGLDLIVLLAPASTPLAITPTTMTFATPSAATQNATVSGGTTPYNTPTSSNAAVATATISGSTVTVTPHGAGSCTITVTDSATPTAGSVTIAVTVYGALTITPAALTLAANAGAVALAVAKSGFSGTISASSSDTTVAQVTPSSGSGPNLTIYALRQAGNGGTANITITAAGADSVVVPVTVYGPITPSGVSTGYGGTTIVGVSEAQYTGLYTAALDDPTLGTLDAASKTATGATAVNFTFTPASGATGETLLTITDDHGGSAQYSINVAGPIVATPSTLTFSSVTASAQTISASAAYDPTSLSAVSSDPTVATVAALPGAGPGSANFSVAPVGPGTCTVTISDALGNSIDISVVVYSQIIVSPATFNFFDPASPAQAISIAGGTPPFTLQITPAGIVAVSMSSSTAGTVAPKFTGVGAIQVVDALGQSVSVPVNVGANLSVQPPAIAFVGAGGTAGLGISGGRAPYTVTSGNTSVATVAGTGPYVVTAQGLGATAITVVDADGETATAFISVQPAPVDPTPSAATNVRVTIFDAKFASVVVLNVGGEVQAVRYDDQPGGCAAGSLQTTLTWEQVYHRGYYLGRSGVEISTMDDYLRAPIAAGATKIYVGDTRPYDTSVHPETPQIAIDDGIHFTARIPVTGVGSDALGPYITVGAPLAGGGNPTTIPAYGSGALIFRRRYSGRIVKDDEANDLTAPASISLQGMSQRINERNLSLAFNQVDVGACVYQALIGGDPTQPPLFADLVIAQANFPNVGTTYTGKRDKVQVAQMIQEVLSVIPGDVWTVRVGHDRTPRLIKLYDSATNTYAFNVALSQKQPYYAAVGVKSSREDTSQLANAIMVTGDTNTQTNQPAAAIVSDDSSIAEYLQIDAPPTSVTGVQTDDGAAKVAQGLLQQRSLPAASHSLSVSCRYDSSAAALYSPVGLQSADALDAIDCVTVAGFNSGGLSPNLIDDSNLALASQVWRVVSYTAAAQWAAVNGAWTLTETSGLNVSAVYTQAISQLAGVPPGAQVTLSAAFALLAATNPFSASLTIALMDPSLQVSYGSLSGTFGQTSRPSATIKLPANVSQFVAVLTYNGTLAANAAINISAIDVRIGPNPGYSDNFAAPAIYGLPSSVQTIVQATGPRVQTAAFAAVQPDWNAHMAELANSIATQLRNNTATVPQIDAYCLSTEALNYTYSATSLALNIPACTAIFESLSIVQAVPAQTIQLAPNATTWVWLNPSLQWFQQTSYASVPGMILLGYFTTNATGVIGDFPKAPIGVVKVGTGNTPKPSSIPAPTIGATFGAVLGAVTARTLGDALATVEVTNVPQDQSVANLAFYYRETGTSAFKLDGQENLAGVPYPPADQTLTHNYANLAYGKSFDLAVAYESVAGYGPLTTFKTAFAMPPTGPGTIGAPTISSATWTGWTNVGSTLSRISVTFTETDFTTQPVNVRFIHLVTRHHGDASTNPGTADVIIDPRTGSGTWTRSVFAPVGGSFDVGVYYEFTDGTHSARTWPLGWNNIADPNGAYFDSGSGYNAPIYSRLPTPVRGVVSSVQDSQGSYLLHGITFAGHLLAQASMVPMTATFNITSVPSNVSGTGPRIAYSWTAWDLQMADGTLDPGNSGASYPSFTGPTVSTDYLGAALTASTAYFVTAAYNWGTVGNVTTWFSKGAISLTQATSFIGDGKVTLQVDKGPINIPATGVTGTNYTAPPPQCPAAWQPIETLERGIVPAGRVRPGEHVRGFGDCWVRVTRNRIHKMQGVRIIIDNRPYDVDANHLFLTRIGWFPAQYLRAGDPVCNHDVRRPFLTVGSVRRLGRIEIAGIEVEGHLLRLDTDDPAVSHNITYVTN